MANKKTIIALTLIFLATVFYFYTSTAQKNGFDFNQIFSIMIFILSGALAPIIETLFFTSTYSVGIRFGYMFLALFVTLPWLLLYKKNSNRVWLVVSGTLWFFFGMIYIAIAST